MRILWREPRARLTQTGISGKRIAHLTTVDSSLVYLLLPQLTGIRDAGGESIGISAPGPWVQSLVDRGIRHCALPSSTRSMSLRADLRAAWELWTILRRERVDILHTHNPKPGIYGRIVARIAGVPLVVNTLHGLYATDQDRLAKRMLFYGLETVAAWCSNLELIQNPEDLALLQRLPLYPRRQLRLLGNGVDLTRFDPDRVSPRERQLMRDSLGVSRDSVVVGVVGRLVAEKGFREFFAAARRLDDRFVCLAIGPNDPDKDDALPPELIAEAKAVGVRFLGMRTDIDLLYSALDIFVLPSYREGFPRAAMEAAASGLPVIATNVRGCRQVVEDGVNGLLVPVRDAGALALAILELGDDPIRRKEMGRAGRRRALEQFDEQNVVNAVLRGYEQLINGPTCKASRA